MSRRHERRPLREWEREPERRSAQQQVGAFRLAGFAILMIGSVLAINGLTGDKRPEGTAPSPATQPRIAVDRALERVTHDRQPYAPLTVGTSAELLRKLRDDLRVDVAILESESALKLAAQERCTQPIAIAVRDGVRYAGCMVNVQGANRARATRALRALTDLRGREALLGDGFDIPEVRPTSP